MSIEAAITSLLEADEALADLVGTRIYPVVVSRSAARPAITYQQMTAQRRRPTSGASGDVRGYWQIIVWAETYGELPGLSQAVRLALDDRKGLWGRTWIESCTLEDESDIAAVDPENEELVFYGRKLTFGLFWYED